MRKEEVIRTESFIDKYRTEKHNGIRNFTKCEHCGFEYTQASVGIVYRHRYRMILCDRCTDNFDGATPWSAEHTRALGLPVFPFQKGE